MLDFYLMGVHGLIFRNKFPLVSGMTLPDPDMAINTKDSSFRCHKALISASIKKIQRLIIANSNKGNLQFSSQLSSVNMKYIIDFVYYGQVEVPLKDVGEFLLIAHELEVDGLYNKSTTVTASLKLQHPLEQNTTVASSSQSLSPHAQLVTFNTANASKISSAQKETVDQCTQTDLLDPTDRYVINPEFPQSIQKLTESGNSLFSGTSFQNPTSAIATPKKRVIAIPEQLNEIMATISSQAQEGQSSQITSKSKPGENSAHYTKAVGGKLNRFINLNRIGLSIFH